MIEVEKKCWVEDYDGLLRLLHERAEYCGETRKRDSYYIHKDYQPGEELKESHKIFRLREASGKQVVTYKEKTMRHGAEVNVEGEFEVSHGDVFRQFTQYINYTPLVDKIKDVRLFQYRGISLELVYLHGLGRFLEAEILCDKDSDIENAINRISQCLSDFGLDSARVEERMYIDLLLDKSK